MKNLRKLGIITLSTGLTIGIFAPGVSATTSFGNEDHSSVQIQIAQSEKVVSKSELMKKFRDLFPQFSFLNDSDLHMDIGYQYPNDDTVRYDLSFHKKINGKYTNGTVVFSGDQLEIERFYYEPANAADALFPAKITKEKAKEAALAFLKKFPESSDYQLDTDLTSFYPANDILTEPIRYTFSFVKIKNKVPISDQNIQITVLGNGEITDFYRSLSGNGSPAYDDVSKVLAVNEVSKKMKENLPIDLQYSIETDFRTGDKRANLTYLPTINLFGIHALSGEWQTMNGFSSELPKEKKIEPIVTQPLGSKQTKFSLEEAKSFAENLLKINSDKIKLRIGTIDETKNYNGQEVISISYMYEYSNGGTGTNLELDKNTGEIIQYHDLRLEVLEENAENKTVAGQAISSEEALNQAIKYLKQYSPSYLHNYSMPVGETFFDKDRESYHFIFPRVVNGILVNGDQISVSIAADGSLLGLNVNRSDIQNWPSVEKAISKEIANTKFFEQLSLKLSYQKEGYGPTYNHYNLVYSPEYSKNPYGYLNAITGEWNHSINTSLPTVSHPRAEKELNYLIQAGILDVKDVKTFDANAKVTKGAALEVMMKSMTRFYHEYPGQKNTSQSFDNIKPDHPLYQVVERAVNLGVLNKDGATFNLDEALTKEELAVWYIRILGLEQAAKNQGIYHLKFEDAKNVQTKNIGYVALAHSLGILTTINNKFNPKQEVTYADLAVSLIPLAHEAYKKGIEFNSY